MRRTTFAAKRKDLTAESSDPRIQLAVTQLREDAFSPHVPIKEIAARLHITSSHLRHLFKKDVGVSPTKYVKLLRLTKARELLESTFLSVKEIMAAVGFADPSRFIRNYKAQYGETPTQTRALILQQRFPSTRRARNFRL